MAEVRPPLGQILQNRGYITQSQLTEALEYQQKLPPGSHMELGEVLISFGFLTPEQLAEALGQQPAFAHDPVGQILILEGVIDRGQLSQALSMQFSAQGEGRKLGTLLVELGFATRSQIEKALQGYQEKKQRPGTAPHPLGQILIDKGLITASDLKDALLHQCKLPRSHKPLGEVLIELGYISDEQLQEALQSQTPFAQKPVGKILVEQGVIQPSQLSHALSLQFSEIPSNKKIGSLLVELGYATRKQIEDALDGYYQQQLHHQTQPGGTSQEPAQPPHPVGRILIDKGYISDSELKEALAYQCKLPREHKQIGEILVEWGYITQSQLEEALGQQPRFEQDPIGKILVEQEVIAQWQLSHALCMQFEPQTQKEKLGNLLIKLGYTTRDEIETALRSYYSQKGQTR